MLRISRFWNLWLADVLTFLRNFESFKSLHSKLRITFLNTAMVAFRHLPSEYSPNIFNIKFIMRTQFGTNTLILHFSKVRHLVLNIGVEFRLSVNNFHCVTWECVYFSNLGYFIYGTVKLVWQLNLSIYFLPPSVGLRFYWSLSSIIPNLITYNTSKYLGLRSIIFNCICVSISTYM